MQFYPQRLIYAAICFIATPVLWTCSGVWGYYYGPDIFSMAFAIAAICFLFAAVGFIMTAVNVEVWDDCYRRL